MTGPISSLHGALEDTGAMAASAWWPDDRRWCVSTDIDFDSTYIGASRSCAVDLLDEARLETFRVAISDDAAADSDVINRLS
jgi:hypothetical protein